MYVDLLIWIATIPVVGISLLLAAELLLGSCAGRFRKPPSATGQLKLAVLIPAHDEEQSIAHTVKTVVRQLTEGQRCVVVADNCNDDTAQVAAESGAEVVERNDPIRRGKGFALQAGIDYLSSDPPAVIVFLDADTPPLPRTVNALAEACAGQRTIQGLNYPGRGAFHGVASAFSAFAFFVKNVVRPSGLTMLGGPAHLHGTGFALPWRVLKEVSLGTGNIVEDMQLGVDVALAGYPARLLRTPCVQPTFPADADVAKTQRRRWEHGHLQTILVSAPKTIYRGVRRCNWGVLLVGLDLLIPPVSLLAVTWFVGLSALAISWWLRSDPAPFMFLLTSVVCATAGFLVAWRRYGRRYLSAADLLKLPLYILWKLPLYAGFVFKRETAWVRTERESEGGPNGNSS